MNFMNVFIFFEQTLNKQQTFLIYYIPDLKHRISGALHQRQESSFIDAVHCRLVF